MAERVGILANLNPGAATPTRLYACGVTRTVGTLTICNSGAAGTFRVWCGEFAQNNTNVATRRYFDATIGANTTVVTPSRWALKNGDWIDVQGSTANFAFAFDGVEETLDA